MTSKKLLPPDKHIRKTDKKWESTYFPGKMTPEQKAEAIGKHCPADGPGHGWPKGKSALGNQGSGGQHQYGTGHDKADKGQRFRKRGEKNNKPGRIRVSGNPSCQLEEQLMHGSVHSHLSGTGSRPSGQQRIRKARQPPVPYTP